MASSGSSTAPTAGRVDAARYLSPVSHQQMTAFAGQFAIPAPTTAMPPVQTPPVLASTPPGLAALAAGLLHLGLPPPGAPVSPLTWPGTLSPLAPPSGALAAPVPLVPAPSAAGALDEHRQLRDGLQAALQALLLTVMAVLQQPELAEVWEPKDLQELGEALHEHTQLLRAPPTLQRVRDLKQALTTASQRHKLAMQRLEHGASAPASHAATLVPSPASSPTQAKSTEPAASSNSGYGPSKPLPPWRTASSRQSAPYGTDLGT